LKPEENGARRSKGNYFFSIKGLYINIEGYQLHPVSATTQCPKTLWMHTTKKEKEKTKK
jgi:hypothetical protein